MRAPCGCEMDVDGLVFHGAEGPCPEQAYRYEPTDEDYCDHGYFGDEWPLPDPDESPADFAVIQAEGGRCYCGARRYPHGGPAPSPSGSPSGEEEQP